MPPNSSELEPVRALTDLGLHDERAKTDLTLEKTEVLAPAGPAAAAAALTQERAETDARLLDERETTDAMVDDAAVHLLDEQAAHARARSAVAGRDQLLAMVSHELRGPLTAIALNANSLLQTAPAALTTRETRQVAQDMKAACGQMVHLVSDLLELPNMEAGRLEVSPLEVDAARVLRDAVAANAPMIHAASLSLQVEYPPEPRLAWIDRPRLLQVFTNLFTNAVKFSPPGGGITASLTGSEVEVQFCVADTGGGIPTEHLGRVFERFWQLAGSDRRGLGLGLYICKAIVEEHGGRIWVCSTPGVGSQFYFTVPTRQPRSTGPSQTIPSASA